MNATSDRQTSIDLMKAQAIAGNGKVTLLPDELLSHGLPHGSWPDGVGLAISLLTGNLDLTEAVISSGVKEGTIGLVKLLRSLMSKSRTKTNSESDVRQFAYQLHQHKIIDDPADKVSNVPSGLMRLIDYRPNLGKIVVADEVVEGETDQNVEPLDWFAIKVNIAEGASFETSVLKQVLQRRPGGRERLILTGPAPPRTVMIDISREGSNAKASTWEIRATDGVEYDMSTYKLRLPVLTQDGIESAMVLKLSSMITCYNDDSREPDRRYLERRYEEWSLVHGGKREWVFQREARARAECATLLVYSYEGIINANDDLIQIVEDHEEGDEEVGNNSEPSGHKDDTTAQRMREDDNVSVPDESKSRSAVKERVTDSEGVFSQAQAEVGAAAEEEWKKTEDDLTSTIFTPEWYRKFREDEVVECETEVVSLEENCLRLMGYRSPSQWLGCSPSNVYIGRESRRHNLNGSKWRNDYKVRTYGLSECLRRYRKMIVEGVDEHGVTNTLWDDLHELRGMSLGCWCHPDLCHGHILKELLQLTDRPVRTLVGKPTWQNFMASIREEEVALVALALKKTIDGPGRNVTERSLSKIWESLAPRTKVHPFYGKGLSDRTGGEDDHMLSNFYWAETQFKYTVPAEIWNIPEEIPGYERVKRRTPIWCYCAEKAIMMCKAAAMGDTDMYLWITRTESPAEAKRLGRAVSNFNQALWDKVVCSVAYDVLHENSRSIIWRGKSLRVRGGTSLAKPRHQTTSGERDWRLTIPR